MATFFCERCQQKTEFLPIFRAKLAAGVSRSTVYYWIEKEWVHWVELPSGRKVICGRSLAAPPARNWAFARSLNYAE